MYTISLVGEDEHGIKFVKSIVKFPSHLGYTGEAIRQRQTVIYTPQKKTKEDDSSRPEIEFQEEIDNYVGETALNWALYSPIIDCKGMIQGVLQLVNQLQPTPNLTSKFTSSFTTQKLPILCSLIATATRNAQLGVNLMSLSHQLKSGVQKVSLASQTLRSVFGLF